jgi:FKBP-type peptidyl-prolyl cis-trans isomerase
MIALLLAAAAQAAAAPAAPLSPQQREGNAIVTTASGLRYQVLEPGSGRRPGPEDAVQVTYEGRLPDGTLFESTPEPVGLPVSGLIPGFTEALQLMPTGSRYRFWIPPALAYGERGAGGVIPPNAELDFTITLVAVGPPAQP